MGKPNRILVLFAHPAFEKSRINRRLINAVQNLEGITIHDLYEHYPNFHIDVKAEQDLLLAHDIIVFHHPFYWYSSPALLKEWQDLVLEHDFAYGHQGTALQGKKCFSTITTGGSAQAYGRQGHNYFTLRELLVPFEQTARLCGMDYLPPFVVQGTHELRQSHQIAPHEEDYRQALIRLRNHQVDWQQLQQHQHFNHYLAQDVSPLEPSLHGQ